VNCEWNQVRVTWPHFSSVPYTTADAFAQKWEPDHAKYTCSSGSAQGLRFLKDGDRSVMLLFTPGGDFAGIQLGTYDRVPMGIQDLYSIYGKESDENGSFLTLTAYTRDPSQICNSMSSTGITIGDRLLVPQGNGLIEVPYQRSDADNQPIWVEGKCFLTMGVHYWYNLTAEADCDHMHPLFALYNHGTLTSFGWAITNFKGFSDRYEHPHGSQVKLFLPSTGYNACLTETDLSTLHVFFTQPLLNVCI